MSLLTAFVPWLTEAHALAELTPLPAPTPPVCAISGGGGVERGSPSQVGPDHAVYPWTDGDEEAPK